MKEMSNRELQLCEYEVLRKFAEFCDNHQLCYFLVDGTLLGAVRHSGFIPWDNDIDVGMPYPDYKKFLDLTQGMLGEHLHVHSAQYTKGYPYAQAKVWDDRTDLVEFCDTAPYHIGAYIDVFPFFGLPQTEEEQLKLQKKANRQMTCHWILTRGCLVWKNSTSLVKKTMGAILSSFASRWYRNGCINKIEHLFSGIPLNEAKYIGEWCSGNRIFRMKKDWILPNLKTHVFEGTKFCIPHDPDAFLRYMYGDYMTLPPENERRIHEIQIWMK